jgi:predicted heme/steroid binding protein
MQLNLFLDFINNSIKEINTDIEKLYSNKYNNMRKTLDHLNSEVMMLDNYINHFSTTNQLRINDTPEQYKNAFAQQVQSVINGTKTFTLEDLAKYDGKDGNPAYVAVNGVVYDVTNNAVWAAATHFGLNAGYDLTNQFASCHAGANILSMLPKVGTII